MTDYLQRNTAEMGSKVAVVFEDQEISWTELWHQVELASTYIGDQLSTSDQQVVSILLPNSIEFIVAYLAIVHSGHMALLLDPAYKSLELDVIIDQIPPAMLITNSIYIKNLSQEHQSTAVLFPLLSKGGKNNKLLRLDPDKQIASLTFTSGTTGKPKVVPNTHSNHIWNIKTCSKVWDWTTNDSLLISSPLSHMLGIVMGLSGVLYHGNTLYLHQWFDAHETLLALSSGKISFFSHAASAYTKLIQAPDKGYDLTKMRLCVSGAAPLAPAVWHEFKKRYGLEILETYGSSETGRITGNSLGQRVLGSAGKPLPGVKLRVGREGEVQVKSKGVFPGYFGNPRATKASQTNDGYWRTGDIGELKDGYLFLKGRVQERIRKFGYTISPRDVEWAVQKHPEVKDIYVLGNQKNDKPDDELVYFIVSDLSDEEILDYCKSNLIFAWRPDKIIRLNEIPRTPSGKPKIGKLRTLVA